MAVWLVRAGPNGEREQIALSEGLAVAGWDELSDLSAVKEDWDRLRAMLAKAYPNASGNTLGNWAGQLWRFLRMKDGDLVVLPLKLQPAFAMGRVAGPYKYRDDLGQWAHHTRQVKWRSETVPRTAIGQDLRFSLGAFMTVCEIQRNDAERRLTAVIEGKPDPGLGTGNANIGARSAGPSVAAKAEDATSAEAAPRDLEVEGRDLIANYLLTYFPAQKMVRVVAGILRAQGFWVKEGPVAGADAGADAIAGRGPLGLDPPRLAVQVKMRADQVGTQELDGLEGAIAKFGADHGLMVSWGGFSSKAREQARTRGFKVRCWDQWDLIRGITENWDRLPDDLRADLPFLRIWTVAPSVEDLEA